MKFTVRPRKARERELAKIDGNRRAVGILNPMRDTKRRHAPEGKRKTPVTTACSEGGRASKVASQKSSELSRKVNGMTKTNKILSW